MTDLNKVILIGRLTQDCGNDERSFKYVGNGTAKAIVSLAVNRSVKKNGNWVDEVSFINVTIWGKTAENLKQYLKKGTQICVEGYLTQDRWEKDGKKESRLNVTAESVQLLGGGNKGGNNQQNDGGFPEDNPFGN
jgi:single-strand DNA-binding protein